MGWQILDNDPPHLVDERDIIRTIAEDGTYPWWRVRLIPHTLGEGVISGVRVVFEVKATENRHWHERQGNLPLALFRYIPELLAEFEQRYFPQGSGSASTAFEQGSVSAFKMPTFDLDSDPPPRHNPLDVFEQLIEAAQLLEPSDERERTIRHLRDVQRQSAINLGIVLPEDDD